MFRLAILVISLTMVLSAPLTAGPDKAAYLALAKKGWVYQLRTTMLRRNLAIPVRISGKTLAGAALCLVGERPNAATEQVLTTFRALSEHSFGRRLPLRYAGPSTKHCGAGRVVVVRLYSGFPPTAAFSDDLNWMNQAFGLGLPDGRSYSVSSPAMAQTFFGRNGQGTHLLVSQARGSASEFEALYFRSILIEELFQAFTFGMDVIQYRRDAPFLSKLQEFPVNPAGAHWNSPRFMRALLRSNPPGLCPFDVFMFHAVAQAPVEETNSPDFLSFIDANFDALSARTEQTLADPRFGPLLDLRCQPLRN